MGKRYLFCFCISFVLTVILSAVCTSVFLLVAALAILLGISVVLLCKSGSRKAASIISFACVFALMWQVIFFTYDKIPRSFFAKTSDVVAEVISYSELSKSGTGINFKVRVRHDNRNIIVRMFYEDVELKLSPGDIIQFDCEYQEFRNTESFAEKTYYKSRYTDVFAFVDVLEVIGEADEIKIRYLPQFLAKQSKDKIDEIYDEDTAAFLKSLIFGDTNGLSEDFNEALRITGLYHAVSVSGMHISFIVSFLVFFTKNKYLKLLSVPIILLFVLMVGAPQSALRAAMMQILLLLSAVGKREYDSLTALSLAAFVLVFINPYCATDTAFLLSFLATLGIVCLYKKILDVMISVLPDMKRMLRVFTIKIFSAISVSVSAMILTAPILSCTFARLSIIAPLTNTVLNPLLTMVFLCGGLNVILGFVIPAIGVPITMFTDFVARRIVDLINVMAKLPFAQIYTGNQVTVVMVCFICAVVVYNITVGREKMRLWFSCSIIAVAALFASIFVALFAPKVEERGVRFDVLDVGQGQCIVATYGEYCVMVDCGGDKEAADIAVSHLLKNGVKDIDALILTHAHADHINGVESLVDTISVDSIYMPASDKENPSFVSITERVGEDCTTVFVSEDCRLECDDVQIEILTLPQGSDENENGLIILFKDMDYELLITGDIPSTSEKLIINRLPDCESYIAGHHGAASSSSLALLNKALPELTAISVGQGNLYGHPSKEALARIENVGSTISRTDITGTITFYSR